MVFIIIIIIAEFECLLVNVMLKLSLVSIAYYQQNALKSEQTGSTVLNFWV